ncbi:NADH-quinone oxidoreductase subunit A [Chitinophaga filiformis]|uniref:NADH-quinone oxidoreductase subunit A n=1 Tax=Chitinophaga filiformis TaxID=104663 RepID=UPI001F48CE82|nr:NADH-quinone oxidoreductase subunit A [Chitinophaga filiformis]MCF6402900.1 NADH-quinone oxidoreductase subunit A [Chitinophaga filiformis]MCF6403182.1 NADH-quinone oxidoreductase subunit A [Chitinophaga filiformis]
MGNETQGIPLWPLLLYSSLVVILLAAILSLSYILGQRHNDRATNRPYEGGIEQTGSARIRFSVQFYLVAMLFVIFDVEAVFIMLWALGFYDLGWPGYIGVALFIAQLVVVLIYEWGIGALNIGADAKKILKALKQKQKQNEMVAK